MNNRYLKIVIFAIVAIILCTVVYFSKQYFDSNYNSHQAVESNLNLYRIKMNEKQESEQQDSNAQIVKEEQVEVHPEATQVVEPEVAPAPASQPAPAKPVPSQQIAPQQTPQTVEKSPTVQPTAPQPATAQPTTQQTQKPLTVSPKTEAKSANGTAKISKPKTLEEKPTVAQTVMKSPEFQTFVIQVGAFSTKVEADIMKARVSKIPAVSKFRVEVKEYPEKKLFKVLVEYFETAEMATQVCGELKQNNVQCFTTKI